ncbi:MAG: hypothetical protein E5Y89_18470 [Mesorhizobium sp.]|uniref:hypothetical protein n=1 Tax=Mesorhizobium sp. TaxID=1871066 RepID=UPI000FD25BA8|nr:hypothetical protein [Mesorhizobium sp.]RVD73653.1 hypothetical protein EN751_03785 [Mesorhizobium sp. M4A.F.Ca.ET.029.04.2.1]TIL77491.1 MAG: hypothetical protein E5Y89_18470 [Mesorhizobium sp.]TIW32435.1 MAG: hypothetical protein E5V62_24995 [Mesorhizobium sp.]
MALFSAGAGHGDYVLARLLYPMPMLATLLTNNTITSVSVVLAVAQFPAYGAFAAPGGRTRWLSLGILHTVAIAAAFSGLLDYF